MKKIFLLFFITGFYCRLQSQNIGVGTLSPKARLHIKGSNDTTQLILEAYTSQSGLHPLIELRNADGLELMRIHADHPSNMFAGWHTGISNSVSALRGINNEFTGSQACVGNTIGYKNSATGYRALFTNTEGYENAASGYQALYSNDITQQNTANGYQALYSALGNEGSVNFASGYRALYNNLNSGNVAIGSLSLFSTTTGAGNTATGVNALYGNLTGSGNCANGNQALFNIQNANNQTAFGAEAMYTFNNTAELGSASCSVGYRSLYKMPFQGDCTSVGYESLYSDSSGHANYAVGYQAMYSNKGCYNNVAQGYQAMYSTNKGSGSVASGYQAMYTQKVPITYEEGFSMKNTACGFQALYSNLDGTYNAAIGYQALSNNTWSSNTACGAEALFSNTKGLGSTAIGFAALHSSITGNSLAIGYNALYLNTIGSWTVGVGSGVLFSTTEAYYNTVMGYNAGQAFDNGYNNVFLGANTDVNGPGYYNVIAIGQATICTGSSQVTFGNPATGSYLAYASWSDISDGRFKKNIVENVPGLSFINKLRPITYNLNATALDVFLRGRISESPNIIYAKALKEKESAVYTGFVAQEVEAAARSLDFNFSGIDAPVNDHDVYGLRYESFVVPLVKAIQELSKQDDQLKKDSEDQQQSLTAIQKQIDKLKSLIKK